MNYSIFSVRRLIIVTTVTDTSITRPKMISRIKVGAEIMLNPLLSSEIINVPKMVPGMLNTPGRRKVAPSMMAVS